MDKSRKLVAFIFITVFLLVNSLSTNAQGDDELADYYTGRPRIFYAGLIGGVNFAQVDGDNFAGYYKFGLNVGGIGYIKLSSHLSLSWEILYSAKGSKSDMAKLSGIDTIVIKNYGIDVKYAEIPVMINVFDKLKSHLGIGISYSRLVSSNETLVLDKNYPINLNNYPFKKDDWEVIVGAQLHLVKGLFLNLRYQYSIVPMRTEIPPNFSRAEQYNNMWTLRLMYLFM